MPLFHRDTESTASSSARRSRHEPEPEPPVTESGRSGLFGSRRSAASTSPPAPSRDSSLSHSGKPSRSLLHRGGHEDPSIRAAREQVVLAENAEKEADRALIAARQAVREAREHVARLEAEAKEEARLAKIKQDQAASISKRARPLGKFGN